MYVQHDLGLLVRLRPKEAALQIVAAYRQAGGVARQAAVWLNVNRSTLRRWVAQLDRGGTDVRARIAEIREQAAA